MPAESVRGKGDIGMIRRLITTKTFWSGLAGIVAGVALCLAHNLPQGTTLIIGGLSTICVRDALATLPAAPKAKR
jgi:hypothetical protein